MSNRSWKKTKKNKTSVGAETYYIRKHPNPMKVSLKHKISSNKSTDRVLMRGKEKQLGLNPTKHKCLSTASYANS